MSDRGCVTDEKLFFMADEEAKGVISSAQVTRLMAYILISLNISAIRKLVSRYDQSGDGRFVRREFMELCVAALDDEPLEYIEVAARNFLLAQTVLVKRHSVRWVQQAENVDMAARFVIPAAFTTALIILSGLKFEDQYASDPQAEMFSGAGHVWMELVSGISAGIPLLCILICMVGALCMRRIADKRKLVDDKPTKSELTARQRHTGKSRLSRASLCAFRRASSMKGKTAETPAGMCVSAESADVELAA